ncbi:MAG: hypothetical protein KTR32_32890 [Granulosicoccus sp.]|nr:hypothetical protein [Granulosicoccus sp.]
MIQSTIKNLVRLVFFTAITILLVACGGGSNDSSSTGDGQTDDANIEDVNQGDTNAGGTGGEEPTDENPVNGSDTVVFPAVEPFSQAFADADGGSVYLNSVNSARLSGPVVGSNEVPTNEVFKSIPFIANDVESGLEVLHAVLHRTGADSGTAYITILIRNNSNDILCDLGHGLITAYDAETNIVSTNSGGSGFIFGPMGVTSTGRLTDSCTSPGQIFYYTALYGSRVTITNTAGVTIESITAGRPGTAATLSVIPVSYEVNDSQMEVLIRNQSSETLTLTGSKIYVLSDSGAPIYYRTGGYNTDLEPGAEMIISASSTRFRGSASSLRVLLDYRIKE